MKSEKRKVSKLTVTFVGIFAYLIIKELTSLIGVDLTRPLVDLFESVFG